MKPNTYYLTRIALLRYLAFIYSVAFLVALFQNKELIGDRGLLPLRLYLERVAAHYPNVKDRILAAPTLLWLVEPWTQVNNYLDQICWTGLTLAAFIMVTGSANMIALFALWILYHSVVAVGQTWYRFGWESQLLETGFLAIWLVPLFEWKMLPKYSPPSWLSIIGYRWLIIRIMLGAGLIKIRGDACWRDMTCMNYFYETQPIPNPLSYYVHQSAHWIHYIETLGNHFIELVCPVLILFLFPFRWCRISFGLSQIFFQLILISTGNLSFLNWLTVVPSLCFLDDKFLSIFFSKEVIERIPSENTSKCEMSFFRQIVEENGIHIYKFKNSMRLCIRLLVGVYLIYLNTPILYNLASSNQVMNTSYDPFRLVNTYGAFGSVTKLRTEIIILGSNKTEVSEDPRHWLEYEFHCKPGRIDRRPCLISPYHYRLDWLMWFAAFQSYQQNPWLLHLLGKLLTKPNEVQSLIAVNPFPTPPKYIRVLHYEYHFHPWSTNHTYHGGQEGKIWWDRKWIGEYVPIITKETLESVYYQFKWTM